MVVAVSCTGCACDSSFCMLNYAVCLSCVMFSRVERHSFSYVINYVNVCLARGTRKAKDIYVAITGDQQPNCSFASKQTGEQNHTRVNLKFTQQNYNLNSIYIHILHNILKLAFPKTGENNSVANGT